MSNETTKEEIMSTAPEPESMFDDLFPEFQPDPVDTFDSLLQLDPSKNAPKIKIDGIEATLDFSKVDEYDWISGSYRRVYNSVQLKDLKDGECVEMYGSKYWHKDGRVSASIRMTFYKSAYNNVLELKFDGESRREALLELFHLIRILREYREKQPA